MNGGHVTFLYFAYGSNMLPARLLRRCPSARLVGIAQACGFSLEFSKTSTDGSGKATLVESRGIIAPGVLFDIDSTDRRALDLAEGLDNGYRRDDDFPVEIIATGARVSATSYIATETDRRLKPFDWYLAVVIAGASHQDINEEHVAMLRGTGYMIDCELNRPARIRALEAMVAHGFKDYRVMLDPTPGPPER